MADLKPRTFKIYNETGLGRDTRIELDGKDVSAAFNHIDIRVPLKGWVEVELGSVVEPVLRDGEFKLLLMPALRDVLIQYGWTPPSD